MGFVSLCKALDLTTPSGRALAAEAGDGQGPARTRASARPPPRRGDRNGVSLASEPYRNRGRPAAYGASQNPFSGRRRQARWGNGNRDGAPGAEPLWSGEGKVGRRSLQDRFLPKRTVLGHKLHFSRKPHKGKTRASAEGILPAACRVCSRLVVSGFCSIS